MGKSSKRELGTQKKSKKKNKVGPDVVAMKVKAPKENPFETIWSGRKFDILGKKRKGEERRVGIARSRGIEKRNKTLLKEYEQRGKSSMFVDKRIGEKNEDLDEFGKAVLRSQRELQLRSKLNKKSKYNLSDGEEEEDYEGLEIQERDDFEDEMVSDDDALETGEPENNSSVVDISNNPRVSVEEGEPNKHKTKKEVMEEIISKSKFFKAQKAKEKEENEQLLEDLDQKFTALIQSKALLSLTEPRKMNSLEALVNKSITIEPSNKGGLSVTQKIDTSMEEKPDAYDKLVKALALEMRARPSDRTKTPEEIAQEERERLERLEEERQKRMTAAEDSSDEDDENSENPPGDKPKLPSGDDLGDSFSVSEETMRKKGWIDEILERENADDSASEDSDASDDAGSSEDADEDSDEDPYEHENNLSLKDWEQSDDEDIQPNLDDEGDDDSDDEKEKDKEAEKHERVNAEKKPDASVLINAKTKRNMENDKKDMDYSDPKKMNFGAKKSSAKSDIPYIIEAPKTFEELCSLVDNCSNSDIIMVINRIRASNAIKLAAENRKKMQVFYGNLLQYFAVLANKKPLNFELLNLMGKPLIEMSMEIPFFAAICARQRIERARKQLVQSLKDPESSSWPSSKMLFLLRLWSLIFPCTDFRHPVMTLAILLMCEYLMRCPILSGRDAAIGSFLCSMLLSIFKQSQKFCPEAIIFLRTMLVLATEKKCTSDGDAQFCRVVELKAPQHLLCMQETVNEIRPLNFIKMIDTPEDSSYFSSDDFRASALAAVIETLRGYVNIYGGLSSFPEIFLPVLTSLHQIEKEENMPNALRDKIKDVAKLIKSKVDEHHATRRPLQMRKKKPEPIKLLNPKFEENYVKGRDYDPDRERAQRRKLHKLYKRESKRAASELRKDSAFLYDVRDKEKALLDQEKAEKYGRARAFLQEQEHAFKSGQLGKGRKRGR